MKPIAFWWSEREGLFSVATIPDQYLLNIIHKIEDNAIFDEDNETVELLEDEYGLELVDNYVNMLIEKEQRGLSDEYLAATDRLDSRRLHDSRVRLLRPDSIRPDIVAFRQQEGQTEQ